MLTEHTMSTLLQVSITQIFVASPYSDL